jgi:hypothetical protein
MEWMKVTSCEMKNKADIQVEGSGAVYVFRPLTKKAAQYLTENAPGNRTGHAVAVSIGKALDFQERLLDAGFTCVYL